MPDNILIENRNEIVFICIPGENVEYYFVFIYTHLKINYTGKKKTTTTVSQTFITVEVSYKERQKVLPPYLFCITWTLMEILFTIKNKQIIFLHFVLNHYKVIFPHNPLSGPHQSSSSSV